MTRRVGGKGHANNPMSRALMQAMLLISKHPISNIDLQGHIVVNQVLVCQSYSF